MQADPELHTLALYRQCRKKGLMSTEQNKAIIQRWVKEAWNAGNLVLADELYAADYAYRDPSAPPMPAGPEAIKQVVATYRAAIPDMRFEIEDMIAEGDKVVWRWMARGTNTGAL